MRDKDDARLFKDSQDRVQAMAMIHEKLYQSRDMARIDFAEYVQDLAEKLYPEYCTQRIKNS